MVSIAKAALLTMVACACGIYTAWNLSAVAAWISPNAVFSLLFASSILVVGGAFMLFNRLLWRFSPRERALMERVAQSLEQGLGAKRVGGGGIVDGFFGTGPIRLAAKDSDACIGVDIYGGGWSLEPELVIALGLRHDGSEFGIIRYDPMNMCFYQGKGSWMAKGGIAAALSGIMDTHEGTRQGNLVLRLNAATELAKELDGAGLSEVYALSNRFMQSPNGSYEPLDQASFWRIDRIVSQMAGPHRGATVIGTMGIETALYSGEFDRALGAMRAVLEKVAGPARGAHL